MTELGVALISEAIGSRLLLDLDDEGGSGQPVHAATMSLEGDDKDTVLADVEAILNRLQVTRHSLTGPRYTPCVWSHAAAWRAVHADEVCDLCVVCTQGPKLQTLVGTYRATYVISCLTFHVPMSPQSCFSEL